MIHISINSRSWLCTLAVARAVHVVIEQPLHSILYRTRVMEGMRLTLSLHRITTWLGAFGGDTPKPLMLWTSIHPDVAERFLQRSRALAMASLTARSDLSETFQVDARLTHRVSCATSSSSAWGGAEWVVGNREGLEGSKAYPECFCEAVAQLAVMSLRKYKPS